MKLQVIEWPDQCVSPADKEHALKAIEEYTLRYGPLSTRDSSAPEKFPFYPMGGTLYADVVTVNFVDLDPTGGLLDWDCTDYTYDGHDASDTGIRGFGEQQIGIPIFSVLDGTVIAAHDGEDDMNVGCAGPPYPVSNYVVIDHGNGRHCKYYHMKKNSVRVSVGQQVRAGEQIGDIGSSGCSTYPHLHFATYDDNGTTLVEPYAGPCRPGESEWLDQTPIRRDTYLQDFNITDEDLGTHPGMPFDIPRTGTFVLGVRLVSEWMLFANIPDSSTWRQRYIKPDGSIQFDSETQDFGGNPFCRWGVLGFGFYVDLDTVGTWHVLFDINDETLVEAPIEVVATINDTVNRPPNPITVQIEPQLPTTNDVLICRVDTDILLDDPDYDIVRYHYEWEVDGETIRDVTTAALSDVLPRGMAVPSSNVTCTVTPSDGMDDGFAVSDSVTLQAPIPVLSYWGIIAVSILLLATGAAILKRKKLRVSGVAARCG